MIRAAVFLLILVVAGPAIAADGALDAARALAQKFADDDAKPAQRSSGAQAPAAKTTKAVAPPAASAQPSRDYEAEMLERARLEQAARIAAARAAAAKEIAPSAAAPATEKTLAQTAPAAAVAPAAVPSETPDSASKATILFAIEMGGSSKIAEMFHGLDPVVCAGETCYISTGIETDAIRLPRSEALKHSVVGEERENACRGMAGCIFRNVSLPGDGATIRLVEMGSGLRVESRSLNASVDTSCTLLEGGLQCEQPIATTDFRIWVVPETTATHVGFAALENAVAGGLQQANQNLANDK